MLGDLDCILYICEVRDPATEAGEDPFGIQASIGRLNNGKLHFSLIVILSAMYQRRFKREMIERESESNKHINSEGQLFNIHRPEMSQMMGIQTAKDVD
jgi:hypothetical protein